MNTICPQVCQFKASVGNHGYILQEIPGFFEVCMSLDTNQNILLPPEDSDLGCVGNWKTSGSCSSELFRCGNFHPRSLDFVVRLENSRQNGCYASDVGSINSKAVKH